VSSLHLASILQFLQKAFVLAAGTGLLALLMSCEPASNGVIDYLHFPPAAVSGSVTPATVNTDTINVGPERLPGDLLPISLFASMKVIPGDGPVNVRYTVYEDRSTSPIAEGVLSDNGAAPDVAASDSTFSGIVQFQILRSVVGTMTVDMVAESGGLKSVALLRTLTIVRANEPPVISNVQAPDTVTLSGETQEIDVYLSASDPDGPDDIRLVYFNSFLPSGAPSSQNPFQMYDDGNLPDHGDASANDGIYSLRIVLPPGTSSGTYRFEFHARDRSNVESNTIVHAILVQP